MTSLGLGLIFAFFAVADDLPRPATSPREIALAYLTDWNPAPARLEPAAMGEVLREFTRRFGVDGADRDDLNLPRGEWSSRLISRLEASGKTPLGDDRVRELVREFLSRYEPEFRAAVEAARAHRSLERSWTGVQAPFAEERPAPAQLAGGCALVLATFGTTLGGGLATAWAYDNPYGAAAGLAPLALYAAGRRAFYELRGPRLRRQARRAAPIFKNLDAALREFAVATEPCAGD